jgi:hypothetical protein
MAVHLSDHRVPYTKLKEKPGNSLKQLGFYGSWFGIFPREAVFGKYISFFPRLIPHSITCQVQFHVRAHAIPSRLSQLNGSPHRLI